MESVGKCPLARLPTYASSWQKTQISLKPPLGRTAVNTGLTRHALADHNWRLALQHNQRMANLASLLKSEISRLARKEIRLEIEPLKRSSAAHRSEIAALKKQVRELQAELARARRSAQRSSTEDPASAQPNLRFRASTLKAHRAKLGLSAKDYGLLLGASALSVYKWEEGKAMPRAGMLAKIAPVLRLGKREATGKLDALRNA